MTPADYWTGWELRGLAFLGGLYVVLVLSLLTVWYVVKR